MSQSNSIRSLVQALPARESAIASLKETGESSWTLRLGEVDVALEWRESIGRLSLSSAIGAPPPQDREFFLQHLLVYSLLMRDTGGVRAALGADGTPILLLDLHGLEAEPDRLVAACHALASQVAAWRAAFARGDAIVKEPAPNFTMFSA